jgi:WD40 repeat protein
MRCSEVSIRLAPAVAVMMVALACWEVRLLGSDSTSYYPTYFERIPGEGLILLPLKEPEVAVSLPPGLPGDFAPIVFSPDGKAIYGQSLRPGPGEGIIKIEFRPTRQSTVRGSSGFGSFSSLVVLPPPRGILISGFSKLAGNGECGTFEIDPEAGTFRTLRAGIYPECGGGGGAISPDGKYGLHFGMTIDSDVKKRSHLSLVDLETGAVQAIGNGISGATWSPNGRWIGAVQNGSDGGSVVLIDANSTKRRRNLGRTESSAVAWSPDSKYLLLARPAELRCGSYLSSLEVIDVQTGRRSRVESSHCRIYSGSIGWLDQGAVR